MTEKDVLAASTTEYEALAMQTMIVGGALIVAAEKLPDATLPAPHQALDREVGMLLRELPSEEAALTALAYIARAIYDGAVPASLSPTPQSVNAAVEAWNLDNRSMADLRALWLKAADATRSDLEVLQGILVALARAAEEPGGEQVPTPAEGEHDDAAHE